MFKLLKFVLICVILAIIGGAIACSSTSGTTNSNDEITTLRSWADPAAQTTLEGLSEGNLEKYTQCSNAQFKAAVTQEMVDEVASLLNTQLGSFQSITFLNTETQGAYIIVHYQAQYSKGQANVRMVFDQEHLVAGQFFE